jgi:tRNA splicing ligase
MSQTTLTLKVTGLAKAKFAKQLIEDGLTIQEKVRNTSFEELLARYNPTSRKVE